jgi:sterol 14-demethylase
LTLAAVQGPLPLMTEMYAKHGEAFTIPILHKRMTFLLGPHASPHFFTATDDKLSQKEVGGCHWRGMTVVSR